MRFLLGGVGLLAVVVATAWGMGTLPAWPGLAAWVGGACWLLAAVLSGALVSGDRIRANFATEDAADRAWRFRWAARWFFLGLPSIAASVTAFVWP